MKLLFLCHFGTVLVGRYGHAADSDNACGPVTCSNHGVCVIQKGEPACACDEGYIPDPTTGLSCQPAASHPPPSLTFAQEQAEIQEALGLAAPPDAAYCLNYKMRYPKRHCAHFWQDYYRRKKTGSLLFLIPGILGMGAGAVMGIVVDPVAGVGIGAAGIILTTAGALMIAKNVRREKQLLPLTSKYSATRWREPRANARARRFRWQGTALSVAF